ncbi:MAG: Uma2 family endonuclease, partial [Brasilonema sp.]
MSAIIEKKYYTPGEYLELEEKADYKSEYCDGAIVPMTGGTTNHNRIIIDFCTDLNLALREQNAEIFSGDVRVWIAQYRLYTYPDIMVVQGQPIYEGTGTTTITNPGVIIEVLSKSTESYDRGDKFRFYRSIAELKEYILINQYSYYAEQFVKTLEGKWILTEYAEKDAILTLNSVKFTMSLQ